MQSYRIEPESLVTSTNGANVELRKYSCRGVAADMHIHSSIEALYFVDGTFETSCNDERYVLKAGDLIIIRKYAIHSVNALSENGGSYYVLKIHPSILRDFSDQESITTFQFFFSLDSNESKWIYRKEEFEKSNIYIPLSEIIKESENNDLFSFMSFKLNVGRFLLAVMRDSHKRKPSTFNFLRLGNNAANSVHMAIEYINANYALDITTKDVAKKLNFSYTCFANCFSKITGKSFKQYLTETRINHAKSKLLSSSQSISEVGSAVGYNSTSYFILEFKKQTGMTPLQYAKKYRDKCVEFYI